MTANLERIDAHIEAIRMAMVWAARLPANRPERAETLRLVQGARRPVQVMETQALFQAAQNGNVRTVRQALDNGADVNARDADGHTAFQVAVGHGYDGVVRLLLNRQDIDNAVDFFDGTALRSAAINGYAAVVELLLNHIMANPELIAAYAREIRATREWIERSPNNYPIYTTILQLLRQAEARIEAQLGHTDAGD
jgi:hypothetical protein